jgi:hypothetical protein
MAVQRLRVEQENQESTPLPESSQEIPQKMRAPSTDNSAVISVFKAISHILAIRLFLLLSVIGSFVLSFMAMAASDSHSVWVLAVYNSLTTLPLVIWDLLARKNREI